MSRERLGIFGGTFDPPHIGHLILASEAYAQLDLKRLLWVLTPLSPLKEREPATTLAERLAMLQVAIAEEPHFELSRIELDQPGPYYTVDTLQLLAKQHPASDLILVIGGDSLKDFPRWHRPADLVSACREIGVMRRPGDTIDLSALENQIPGAQAKVRFIDAPLLEIASRDIRRRVQQGVPFRYYLSEPVFRYIIEEGLYQ